MDMNAEKRTPQSRFYNETLDDGVIGLLVCSENSLLAADYLRSALADLNAVYKEIEKIVILAKREDSTSIKES